MGIIDDLNEMTDESELNYEYDANDTKSFEDKRHTIPEGTEIDFYITKAEYKKSKSDKLFVKVKATIFTGQYSGINMFHFFYMPYNRAKFNRLILALRPITDSIIKGKLSETIVNRCAHGRIIHERDFNTGEVKDDPKYGPNLRFGSLSDVEVVENPEFIPCSNVIIAEFENYLQKKENLPF